MISDLLRAVQACPNVEVSAWVKGEKVCALLKLTKEQRRLLLGALATRVMAFRVIVYD